MNKTKKYILDAAISIFSTYGYNSATIDIIADSAGVTKGTIYYHFKSKKDIFKYIIGEGINKIIYEIEQKCNDEQDSLTKIKLLCRIQLRLMQENKNLFKVIMSQIWGKEDDELEIKVLVSTYIKHIEKYLKEAMYQDKIKCGEVSFMAYTLFATLCSVSVYDFINSTKSFDTNQVHEKIIEYILYGIKK